MSDSKGIDLLGIKPIGEAINTTVAKSFEGIEGFLKAVCVPALEELGLLLKDQVRHWRLNNIIKILQKAKGRIDIENGQLQIKAHPRVALSIIENGSLNDIDEIQELWAGLFVSSCTKDGQDDENLIFVNLLKQLTIIEARVLKYACEHARKILHKNDLLTASRLEVGLDQLFGLTGCNDMNRLDRELDHLRYLGLIGLNGGFSTEDKVLVANISPTALALNLYVKSQGFNNEPAKYWDGQVISLEEWQAEEHRKYEERKAKEKGKYNTSNTE